MNLTVNEITKDKYQLIHDIMNNFSDSYYIKDFNDIIRLIELHYSRLL